MIARPWRFYFLLSANLKNEWPVKAGRLFETGKYGVVSTYIAMWKCEGTRATQCDHLETKFPGKDNIIISK